LAFPRQTLSEDIDPLPAGKLLSGRLGGDMMPIRTIIIKIIIMLIKNNNNNKINNDDDG
jgi:hypothetical protein